MSAAPTVFVVDDEPAVRKAVRLMLLAGGHEVEVFSGAAEFLEAFDPSRPGCLVCDVRMPGMDGMELLRRLASEGMRIPVIMLTAHGDIPMAVDAIHTGAVDFLQKPADADTLRRKVAEAIARDADSRVRDAERIEVLELLGTLTAREREVLEFLADGKPVKTIAGILGTSPNTVRAQRTTIMKKMRADNVSDLVKMMHLVSDAK